MRPNLPNSISLVRVLMVPILMVFMLAQIPAGDVVALVVLILAAGSDSLDGYVARRRRQTTVMGAFLDPLADKLLVIGALVSLVALDRLSAWVAMMIVIARELAVSGLRMVAAVQSIVIPASTWGKAKTVSQMLAIAALIVEPRWLKPEWTLWGHRVTWYLVMLMLVLTVVSGIDYFVSARHELRARLVSGKEERWDPAGGELKKVDATGEETQRLFVAVPLPHELTSFVHSAQALLPVAPGLRLLRADQLHLTLAFIGEVDGTKGAAAKAVVESLPTASGGEGTIRRFLLLPSAAKARVVALEVVDDGGVFADLFGRVMGGLEAAGVMQREKRPFRPHLTIARLRTPGPVRPRSESGEARFAVESVCLYKSELKREGAAYTVLARAVFGREDGAKA